MTCDGICKKHKAAGGGGNGKSRYALGHKFCRLCGIYVKWDGKFCPCCNFMLRTRPRKSILKAKLREYEKNVL